MYNVADHGDLLEKEATGLIRSLFPNYELVWKTYVGNTGLGHRAPLPNYPREEKRISFSQHSYSVLESAFIIQRLLDTKVFESPMGTFEQYIAFQQSFLTFFSFLGRMHDMVKRASEDLPYDNTSFLATIHEFYEARSIVIHGKRVPTVFDELGLMQMPQLQTSSTKGAGWDDKRNTWFDVQHLPTTYVADNCADYFAELLALINDEYARFYDVICQELKAISTELTFVREDMGNVIVRDAYLRESSGTTRVAVDVYNSKEMERLRRKHDPLR